MKDNVIWVGRISELESEGLLEDLKPRHRKSHERTLLDCVHVLGGRRPPSVEARACEFDVGCFVVSLPELKANKIKELVVCALWDLAWVSLNFYSLSKVFLRSLLLNFDARQPSL